MAMLTKEKDMADRKISDAERRRRARLRRQREELRRRRRRRAYILRSVLAAIGILLIVLAVWGIAGALGNGQSGAEQTGAEAQSDGTQAMSREEYAALLAAQYDYDGAVEVLNETEGAGRSSEIQAAITEYRTAQADLVEMSAATVRHFSFPTLLVNGDAAAEGTSPLTVDQFNQILQELYDNGYVLVDLYDLVETVTDSAGSTAFQMGSIWLPEGKKPFVLSQRDVSYPFEKAGNGYASRLVLNSDGNIVNEYMQPDGSTVTGNYDVVPCLNAFIEEHPDFCYRGARGTLGLTGYNGILGYRTSSYLSSEENNPYAAAYGTFDTAAETENCRQVVEALKNSGWNLASYGNNYISYGSELSLVEADNGQWQSDVAALIGGSDILIYPCETDIGSWSEYTDSNEKYTYLQSQGFRYFCIEAGSNLTWIQVRPGYVRQGIHEIDTYEEFQNVMNLENA